MKKNLEPLFIFSSLWEGGEGSPDKSIKCGYKCITGSIIEAGRLFFICTTCSEGSPNQTAAWGGGRMGGLWGWDCGSLCGELQGVVGAEWTSSFKHLGSTFFCHFEFYRHSISGCWHAKETGSLRGYKITPLTLILIEP